MSHKQARYSILCLTAAVYIVCVVALLVTMAPWWDEGLLAGPAYTFMKYGYLGSDVFVSMAFFGPLPGITKHLYAWMPLYLIAVAEWMKVTSYSLVSMRLMSLLFGLVMLASWYMILWKLTKRHAVSILATILIATDYYFVIQSATARYETMTGGLGLAAWAAYLYLRESRFSWAVLVASTLVATSIFTHPLGALYAAGLIVFFALLDRRKISWRVFVLAALPFVVFGAGWGMYILQAPGDFAGQFRNHTAYRTAALQNPILSILTDFYSRYIFDSFTNLTARWMVPVRAATELIYLLGFLGTLLTPGVRRYLAGQFLLVISILFYIGIALLDSGKSPQYMVHMFTPLLALTAVWIEYCYRTYRGLRLVLGAVVFGVVITSLAAIAVKARKDPWKANYDPVASFVKKHLQPGDLVIGPAQLTFALGPEARLKDDAYLGYGFEWGKDPKLIVANGYWDLDALSQERDAPGAFVKKRLLEYQVIYNNHGYEVYARHVSP